MCSPYILENSNKVTNPVLQNKKHRITSDFLETRSVGTSPHMGIDITGDDSGKVDTIIAIDSGTVAKILYNDSVRGNAVWIKHDSYYSVYEHMRKDSIKVSLNQKVAKGQPIGYMGSTGASTGNHLHLSIIKDINGKWSSTSNQMDPRKFIWGQMKLTKVSDVYDGGVWSALESAADYLVDIGAVGGAGVDGVLYKSWNLKGSSSTLTNTSSSGNVNTITYETKTEQVDVQTTHTVDYAGDTGKTKSTGLLTYPSLVEAPFIKLQVGDYTFGSYNAVQSGSTVKVQYPNYITGLQVTKVNGSVNQYTINMVYQIAAGNDPNMIDKILSTVGYGTVKISYGDWQSPTFIYKEEEALITNVKTNVDFKSAKINYTISCTSNALNLCSTTFSFPAFTGKPSDKIKQMLNSASDYYGLKAAFPGMANSTSVEINNLIASNDKAVKVPACEMDALSYINKLVTYMVAETNADSAILLDSSYYLTIVDDTYGDMKGCYFTIKQMMANSKTLASYDTYTVDIGYPSDNMVMNFQVNSDNSWSLLYNYGEKVDTQDYTYSIDSNGSLVADYSPSYAISTSDFKTTAAQRTWWTNMTQFPISAELTIKGLLRPMMLMTYIKINSYFYGQKHASSGLYFVTKQVDTVDSRGYRTTLSLTRFAGDDTYTSTETQTVTYKVPVVTKTTTSTSNSTSNDEDTSSKYKLVESNPLVIENNKVSNEELANGFDYSGSPLVIRNNKRK